MNSAYSKELFRKKDSSKKFVVVSFPDEGETMEVIHTSWIDKSSNILQCYWPDTAPEKNAKEETKPDKKKWTVHKIKIQKGTFTDDYVEASKKCDELLYESSLESEEYLNSSRPMSSTLNCGNSTGSDDEAENDSCEAGNSGSVIAFGENEEIENTTPDVESRAEESFFDGEASKPMEEYLAEIIANQKKILTLLEHGKSEEMEEEEKLVKAETEEELEEINEKLKSSKEVRRMTVKNLTRLGGDTLSIRVRKMLHETATPQVWRNYSVKGQKQKKAFKNLTLYKLMFRAVLKVDGKADCLKFDLALGNALKQFPYKCQLLEKKRSATPAVVNVSSDEESAS